MSVKLIIISSLVFSSMITTFLAMYAFFKIKKASSIVYILLMLCISLYSLGGAIELNATTIDALFFAIKIEYIGIVFTPAFWMIFTLQYTGIENKRIKSHYPLLFVIPIITLILVFTNDSHHLYYQTLGIKKSQFLSIAVIERGFWYYIFLIFNNLIIFTGNFLFIRLMIRSKGYLKIQAMITFIASTIPWIGDILYLLGYNLYGIDHTPFFLTLMGPLLLFAMFRFKMLNLTPIARSIVFNEMKDPVFVLDEEDRLVDQNNAAIHFLKDYNLCSGELSVQSELIDLEMLQKLVHKNSGGEIRFLDKESGKTNYYNSHVTPISSYSKNKIGNILTLQDVTIENEMIEKLHTLATTDGLTGLHNRRNLMKLCEIELKKSKRHNRPLSILLMDLDLFKRINDTYGHSIGDRTLQMVAQTLIKALRTQDILGRYGGEEFAAILPETDSEGTVKTAERLRESIESLEIPYKNESINITISIGSMTIDSNKHNQTIEKIFSKADEALYRAKETGRNRVIDFSSLIQTMTPSD